MDFDVEAFGAFDHIDRQTATGWLSTNSVRQRYSYAKLRLFVVSLDLMRSWQSIISTLTSKFHIRSLAEVNAALQSRKAISPVSSHALRSQYCLARKTSFRPIGRQCTRKIHTSTIKRANENITSDEPTIYALSTAPGRAAIAIIRISGSQSLDIYKALTGSLQAPKPRYATLKSLHDPDDATKIIESAALLLYFPAPNTATGEDVLELHVHGGNAIVKAVLKAIPKVAYQGKSPAIRYAEPGEFTRRAYWNGRLDLTQVEALGETLAAETEQQRQLAVKGASALLAQKYEEWRRLLLHARGELEALIDFSEDQHFDEGAGSMVESITAQVGQLRSYLTINIENANRGELVRKGFNIALLGAPNVGKSSLLNQIVQREAAIVSSQAGTTRDVVDVGVDIHGFYCRFGDLAGLRDAEQGDGPVPKDHLDPVEEEGMRRAIQRALEADLVLVILDIQPNSTKPALSPLDSKVIEAIRAVTTAKQEILYVVNKTDLLPDDQRNQFDSQSEVIKILKPARLESTLHQDPVLVSCQAQVPRAHNMEGEIGISGLLRILEDILRSKSEAITSTTGDLPQSFWEQSLGASERQRLLLQQCLACLDRFIDCVCGSQRHNHTDEAVLDTDNIDAVLGAEHLREAAMCLAKITGKGEMGGDVEEVLGVVFENFCVGK